MSESPGSVDWVRPPVPIDRLVYLVSYRTVGTGDGPRPMVSGQEMTVAALLHSYGHYVVAGHRRLAPPTLDRDYSRGAAKKYLDNDSWEIPLHHQGKHVASLITVENSFPGLDVDKPLREAVLPVLVDVLPHTPVSTVPVSELDARRVLGGEPPELPRTWWCRDCCRLIPDTELADVVHTTDGRSRFDRIGTHTECGERSAEHVSAGALFTALALVAIPHELISSPAVGAGDARRVKLAAALWPAVQVVFAATGAGPAEPAGPVAAQSSPARDGDDTWSRWRNALLDVVDSAEVDVDRYVPHARDTVADVLATRLRPEQVTHREMTALLALAGTLSRRVPLCSSPAHAALQAELAAHTAFLDANRNPIPAAVPGCAGGSCKRAAVVGVWTRGAEKPLCQDDALPELDRQGVIVTVYGTDPQVALLLERQADR
ncbi:hypothetical protein [Saccharothrix sp. HUAS TT1]|uniref:hypothetical protein n=1 Tax=unclassified Saccharothrix TaxID=2593673 RepID=UPI00345C3F27